MAAHSPREHAEVIIAGGGVAGLTAAILVAQAGLHPIVLEREAQSPTRPGETLHPGIEPIFDKLGIAAQMSDMATARPLGIAHWTDGQVTKVPYGGPPEDPWRGFQIRRDALTAVLRDRAEALGAQIRFGQSPAAILRNDESGVEIATADGPMASRWFIDATGSSAWSSRQDGTGFDHASPMQIVCYGYEASADDADPEWPVFTQDPRGWSYRAPLGDGETAWVRRFASRQAFRARKPARCRVVDGTWKISQVPAQNRLYRIGDAACTIDPSSGKGILRAMMSAMMAVHLISCVSKKAVDRHVASDHYAQWVHRFFDGEISELGKLSPPETINCRNA